MWSSVGKFWVDFFLAETLIDMLVYCHCGLWFSTFYPQCCLTSCDIASSLPEETSNWVFNLPSSLTSNRLHFNYYPNSRSTPSCSSSLRSLTSWASSAITQQSGIIYLHCILKLWVQCLLLPLLLHWIFHSYESKCHLLNAIVTALWWHSGRQPVTSCRNNTQIQNWPTN